MARDRTAEPVSRDQILRRERGQGNIIFPCSAGHEQDWQPYPVDPYYAICDNHTYIPTRTYSLPLILFFYCSGDERSTAGMRILRLVCACLNLGAPRATFQG